MKLKSIALIIATLAVLVIIKLVWLPSTNNTNSTQPNTKKNITSITAFIAKSQLLENRLYSTGTLLANEEVTLHAEVSGKLTHIYFKEGHIVAKGALLGKINDAELQAQLKRLQYQYKLADEKSERLSHLLQIQGISQQEYDESVTQLNLFRSEMEYTRALIAKTEIRAPFAGRIGLRQVSEGGYITPATNIASIQQTNILKLDFSIPEKYSALFNLGDKVQFTTNNSNQPYLATIYAFEPKIDAETRNLNVRAVCESSNNLLPGTFVRVELITSKNETSLMIPTEAVIPDLKGKKVFVIRNGKAIPIQVETGLRNDAQIEIVNGLEEGDSVIVSGIMSLKPESEVKVTKLLN